MRLPVRKRRFLAWRRPSFAAAAQVITLGMIAGASGCASAPTSGTFGEIRSSEGARWLSAETVPEYGCGAGALVCGADGGRLSERRCRCGPAR
jgi:hypothetical protein